MSDALFNLLDQTAAFLAAHHCDAKAIDEAKDEITRLRAQVASLTAAPTPGMIAAAWAVIDQQKRDAGIAKLGPGLGVREIYEAMIAAAIREGGNV